MEAALRSGLITPGLELELLRKASQSDVDFVHIELEDGVPSARKEEARATISQALTELDWEGKLTLVRINPLDSGFTEDDVIGIAEAKPDALLLGKCQGPDDIKYLDQFLTWVENKKGLEAGAIRLSAMIERAAALKSIDDIATASERMIALYIGPSDLGNEVGYRRAYHGLEMETMWVRSRVVIAAHTAGLLAFDSPYVPYRDLDGTYEQARWSYRLGFDAKSSISPRQLDAVNRAFTPTEEEIKWARDVLQGEEEAINDDRSVWVAQDMMLDAPHVVRSRRILASAQKAGLVPEADEE